MVLHTKRLIIRQATVADAPLYYKLWTNPKVMIFVGFPQGLRITQEQIEQRIRKQEAGFLDQRLVVELRSTGEAIGECTMHTPDIKAIASTDVKLLPAYWRHKYGVEVKRELLSFLFTYTKCTAVQASPNIKNIASIKMQEAVGGVRIGEDLYEFPPSMQAYTIPVPHYIYHVRRKDWH